MARAIMGGDFRAIRRQVAAPAAPEPDPRLALVDLFASAQSAPQGDADPQPLPEGALDLSGDEPMRVTADGSLVPAVATEPEPTDTAAPDAAEDAGGAPGPEDEPVEDPAPADEKDYDPIAAVLG